MQNLRRMQALLGTYVEISARSPDANLEQAVSAAYASINQIQQLLSFHDSHSDLSKLNMAKTGSQVDMHPVSLRVLRLAKAMMQKSQGLFNCTVGGSLVKQGILPRHSSQAFLSMGQADDLQISRGRASLKRPVLITLDGIAKGYAVDCAIKVLKQHGCIAGLVNAGGDLAVFGEMSAPIYQRSLNDDAQLLGHLQNAALASSAVRAEHDPNFPACLVGEDRSPKIGVFSVIAHHAWRADALTKVASLASEADRVSLLTKLGGRLVAPIEREAP